MKRNLIICLILSVVLTGCSGSALSPKRISQLAAELRHEQKTEPITVRVIKVECSDNVASSVLVGTIEASKSAHVITQYPGCIKEILVRKGQKISAGTIIAKMDSQTLISAYDASKAIYEQACDALSRIEQVYGSGSVAEVKLIDAKTAVAKAETAFRAAEKSLDDCSIKAPYSGVVGEIYPHEGMELPALAPVIQLMDISSVEVHASIPENEYASCRPGMAVRIEVPATGVELDGVLAVKGIDASKITRSYDCTFKFTQSSQTSEIMPGMVCKVRLSQEGGKVVVIPALAVKLDEAGRYVWCCNEGTIYKKHIETGGFSGKGIIVTEGLEAGEMLVVEGARKISAGMTGIRIIE